MMKILPLAFDSMGVRSQATFLENVFIDAGAALGPKRYGMSPTGVEHLTLELAQKTILNYTSETDLHIITHYHYDHYIPEFKPDHLKLYSGKRLLVKHPKENINKSQQNRARKFLSSIKDRCQVEFADNFSFDIGKMRIEFSPAVWHGELKSRVGRVIMCSITRADESFVFGSDAQGPLDETALKWIISQNPNTAIIDGPISYMLGQWIGKKQLKKAVSNLESIMTSTDVKTIIYDHHLVRDIKYKERMARAYEAAEEHQVKLITAAEYLGKENLFLEAWRKKITKGEMHIPESKVKEYY